MLHRELRQQNWACRYCKPVSVPRRAAVIPLGRASLPGSSNLPGSRTERAAPPPLFGLAPHGVYPAGADYSVRGALLPHLFTLTWNPGKNPSPRRYFFCGTFRETRFERAPPAVSRHAALWRPDFPPGPAGRSPPNQATTRTSRLSSFSQNFGVTVTVKSESTE